MEGNTVFTSGFHIGIFFSFFWSKEHWNLYKKKTLRIFIWAATHRAMIASHEMRRLSLQHCRQLGPGWRSLGQRLPNRDGVHSKMNNVCTRYVRVCLWFCMCCGFKAFCEQQQTVKMWPFGGEKRRNTAIFSDVRVDSHQTPISSVIRVCHEFADNRGI